MGLERKIIFLLTGFLLNCCEPNKPNESERVIERQKTVEIEEVRNKALAELSILIKAQRAPSSFIRFGGREAYDSLGNKYDWSATSFDEEIYTLKIKDKRGKEWKYKLKVDSKKNIIDTIYIK